MLLEIDFTDDIPIYMQIRNQIVMGIGSGKLKPGDKLPTIRSLANESGINMMTVSKAYQHLKQEGYIQSNRRNGATISANLPGKNRFDEKSREGLRQLLLEAKANSVPYEDIIELCQTIYMDKENEDYGD